MQPPRINIQPIEKAINLKTKLPSDDLDIQKIFATIQGEGPYGTPAIFIRLAGCNLQCPKCDTDYTSNRRQMTIIDILMDVAILAKNTIKLIVITGGEPFRQDIQHLLKRLCNQGYFVQIETNGTLPAQSNNYQLDISKRSGVYIVCSPKTGKIHPSIYDHACAFKYVIDYRSIDHDAMMPISVLEHSVSPHVYQLPNITKKLVYMQAMDHENELDNAKSLKEAIQICLHHNFILGLQIHKIIGLD